MTGTGSILESATPVLSSSTTSSNIHKFTFTGRLAQDSQWRRIQVEVAQALRFSQQETALEILPSRAGGGVVVSVVAATHVHVVVVVVVVAAAGVHHGVTAAARTRTARVSRVGRIQVGRRVGLAVGLGVCLGVGVGVRL